MMQLLSLTFAVLSASTGPSSGLAVSPLGSLIQSTPATSEPANEGEFARAVQPFLEKYCADCHGDRRQRAEFRVDDLEGRIHQGRDIERWEKVLEMVSLSQMPPRKADQPERLERHRVTGWIDGQLRAIGRGMSADKLALPGQANRVPHEELFSGEHRGPAASPPRLWRKSAPIYLRMANDLRVQLSQPFLGLGGKGMQDYASLLADESTISTMLRNAKLIASSLIDKDRARLHWLARSDPPPEEGEISRGIDSLFELFFQRKPTDTDRDRYVEGLFEQNRALGDFRLAFETLIMAMLLSPEFVFRMELGLGEQLADGRRALSADELAYALSFAFFDQPDHELLKAAHEGRLRSKQDVEREVRALFERKDDRRRYWNYPMYHLWHRDYYSVRPRVLRFFQEFFGYAAAPDVFKDRERNPDHHANRLRKDADWLVLRVLEKDEQVFASLLTTREYPVDPFFEDKLQKTLNGTNQRAIDHLRNKYGREFEAIAKGTKWPGIDSRHVSAYDLSREESDALRRDPGEPLVMPADRRAGILTHPAWLVAHSGNFDTDPIRRGKWIRERLLAQVVPEIPIGVDARVPEDPHRTLRERMEVVEPDECWRCHRLMNPLGMPFEEFDDFGRSRDQIVLGDADSFFREQRRVNEQRARWQREIRDWLEQTPETWRQKAAAAQAELDQLTEPNEEEANFPEAQKRYENSQRRWSRELERWSAMTDAVRQGEVDKRQQQIDRLVDPIAEAKPVDATGELQGSGDPSLDGPVDGAVELVERLAQSERARQSFIRHAFRYWMGRNETLDDSPTLISADRAYVESNGSFRELLVSLLTSDSFLYRDGQAPEPSPTEVER